MFLSRRARRPRAGRGAASFAAFAIALGLGLTSGASPAGAETGGTSTPRILGIWEPASLSGANNNREHPTWGATGTIYPRLAPSRYVDGIGQPYGGPNARYISNRVFNDTDVHLYSRRGVSQWGFVWGQFLDHTMAMRLGRRQTGATGEPMNIPFDQSDPLETYRNDLGLIFLERSVPAPGTGETNVREQVNLVNSYLDAETVYGATDGRLDWLREGTVDGNPTNNRARLLMPNEFLPRARTRGDAATAPLMVIGSLFEHPEEVAVAGDPRANENPPLLATHTVFAREHNRIVAKLPKWMSEQDKFSIARAVVVAQQQYITYHEFLPTLGVTLPRYRGYKQGVDASISNEFATVGYRGHSMIRSDFTIETEASRYSAADLAYFRGVGLQVTERGSAVELMVPLGEETFFNPDLLERLQLGPTLKGIGLRSQNDNEEQINNLMRSLVFDFSGNPGCAQNPNGPTCLPGVNDLSAVDIERGRDHGMPTYNQLRRAYGLAPKSTFQAITGEASASFPADPELTPGQEIDDPDSLDFTKLYDINGNPTTVAADNATRGDRRAPLAARLKAIYQTTDAVDAFVGMAAEKHLPGREFGELQLAIWTKQFTATRDGDRFFYANDPMLPIVRQLFGIDYRVSLGDVIARNTDTPRSALSDNVFLIPTEQDRVRTRGAEAERSGGPGRSTRSAGGGGDAPQPGSQGQPPATAPAGTAVGSSRRGAPRRRRAG